MKTLFPLVGKEAKLTRCYIIQAAILRKTIFLGWAQKISLDVSHNRKSREIPESMFTAHLGSLERKIKAPF